MQLEREPTYGLSPEYYMAVSSQLMGIIKLFRARLPHTA